MTSSHARPNVIDYFSNASSSPASSRYGTLTDSEAGNCHQTYDIWISANRPGYFFF